jgi:hypothetical protein
MSTAPAKRRRSKGYKGMVNYERCLSIILDANFSRIRLTDDANQYKRDMLISSMRRRYVPEFRDLDVARQPEAVQIKGFAG